MQTIAAQEVLRIWYVPGHWFKVQIETSGDKVRALECRMRRHDKASSTVTSRLADSSQSIVLGRRLNSVISSGSVSGGEKVVG